MKSDSAIVLKIQAIEVLKESEGSLIMVRGKVKIGFELYLKITGSIENKLEETVAS